MIPRNELALAYELRQCGCSWRNIGIGLGYSAAKISRAVWGAQHG